MTIQNGYKDWVEDFADNYEFEFKIGEGIKTPPAIEKMQKKTLTIDNVTNGVITFQDEEFVFEADNTEYIVMALLIKSSAIEIYYDDEFSKTWTYGGKFKLNSLNLKIIPGV